MGPTCEVMPQIPLENRFVLPQCRLGAPAITLFSEIHKEPDMRGISHTLQSNINIYFILVH